MFCERDALRSRRSEPICFRTYSQLHVLVESYGSSDAEKNFVAAWKNVNRERFDID